MPTTELDTFTRAYVECALWSSHDNANDQGGEPLDANYTVDNIAPETLEQMVSDCIDFRRIGIDAPKGSWVNELVGDREVRAGQDFWLTRCRHGAGFWDGDWQEPYVELDDDGKPCMAQRWPTVGDYLTEMAHAYGSYDLYIGDDGLIYGA
jgi:hypothetical protein